MLTATFSVNGEPIKSENLKKLQITKKDYIDYVESLIKEANKHIKENMKG